MYRTRAITTRGLYIFNLIFFHKPRFILQTIYVLKNANSSFFKPEIRRLSIHESGYWSRAGLMARPYSMWLILCRPQISSV